MRPLNRPMFKMGGPIKEGIMDGMKEPQAINTVGNNANRDIMGATNPKDAKEGTIREKYGISIDKNSVHGSDSIENAKIEIDFFFKD